MSAVLELAEQLEAEDGWFRSFRRDTARRIRKAAAKDATRLALLEAVAEAAQEMRDGPGVDAPLHYALAALEADS